MAATALGEVHAPDAGLDAGGSKATICAKICPMVQGASFPRPVLLTLAVLFAATVILYSAIWMYAARWESEVLLGVGLQYSPTTRSYRVTTVGEGSAAERAGLVVDDRVDAEQERRARRVRLPREVRPAAEWIVFTRGMVAVRGIEPRSRG